MFSKKRDTQELIESYRERIEQLEKRPGYVTIRVPDSKEAEIQYVNSVAQLDENEFLLFHLVDMWEKTTQKFLKAPIERSDFYKGRLSAINDLISDGRKCSQKGRMNAA